MSDLTTLKKQVLEALKRTGDDPASLVCYYQGLSAHSWGPERGVIEPIIGPCSVEALPKIEYNYGYGSVEGERFLAFSERYVYFRAEHDGLEWIDFVPRSPASIRELLPIIGQVD